MNEIIFLPPARKYLKKIKDTKLKKIFQDTLEAIRIDPTIGQLKTGDLNGIYAYGFRYQSTDYRIAYKVSVNEDGTLTIVIMIGSRENFYNELKDYLN